MLIPRWTKYLIFIVSLLFGFDMGSSLFSPCPPSYTKQHPNSTVEGCGISQSVSVRLLGSIVDFIATHDQFVTAGSTFIIALFTVVLVVVTDRQEKLTGIAANAAKDSADALPKLERAYLFIQISDPMFDIGLQQILFSNRHIPTINFSFINYGRTPAILKGISATIELVMKEDIDREFRYLDWEDIKGEQVVRTDKSAGSMSRDLTTPVTKEMVEEIRKANVWFRFYGVAMYEDVFGVPHETHFFWLYNGLAKSLVLHEVAGKKYNRRT